MRKNLLLLIMFCLVATIGAKATPNASGSLSADGTTFTITTTQEGDVAQYFGSTEKISNTSTKTYSELLKDTQITTLVVVGPMKSDPDLTYLAFKMSEKIHITTLDLTNAVFTSSQQDVWDQTTRTTISETVWEGLIFPTNDKENEVDNYLKTKLETIKFPKTGVKAIPSKGMAGYSIKNVIIPCGYTTISSEAFSRCPNLQIINIPEGVTSIGSEAFRNSVIQAVRLPNSLLTIGDNAFNTCGGLASITIPAKVTSIGNNAFECCYGIRDVYVLAKKAPTLGSKAFDEQTVMGCRGGYPDAIKQGITSATRKNYWIDGHHYAILHYPSESIDSYTDQYFVKQYTLDGDDYLAKYPTQKQAKALNQDGQDETDANGNITKHAPHSELNDWKSFTLSKAIDGAIQPIPNIAASRWYTMCFDFDLTKDQIESAFGAGTEVCRFQGVKYTNDGKNNVTATLDFTKDMYDATTEASKKITEAGHPYMIHPAAATSTVEYKASNPIYYVTGVTKVSKCPLVDDYGQVFDSTEGTATKDGYYPRESYIFKGNLGSETKVPTGSYYLSRNKETDDDEKEDGHRAFYYNVNGDYNWTQYAATLYEDHSKENYHGKTTNAGAKTCVAFGNDAVIFTSDNSTTGIENTESENSNETSVKFADKVFSISGQLVRTGSSSLDGLAKGMYIVNGKKYIVK